jgi:hypothetical protein
VSEVNVTTGRPAVGCDGVVLRYGDTVAVDQLSFEGLVGGGVALLGPNGRKTSTVEARGLSPGGPGLGPGPRPRPRRPRRWSPHGVMLQKGASTRCQPAQVLRLFAAYHDDAEDPDGLSTWWTLRRPPHPGRRLSGGEQQRSALALALVGGRASSSSTSPRRRHPEGRIVVRGHRRTAPPRRLRDPDHPRVVRKPSGWPIGWSSSTAAGWPKAPLRPCPRHRRRVHPRFSTDPGIDTAGLALTMGSGPPSKRSGRAPIAPVRRRRTHPAVVAALAGWLAERPGRAISAPSSLEEAYLAITALPGTGDPPASQPPVRPHWPAGRSAQTMRPLKAQLRPS